MDHTIEYRQIRKDNVKMINDIKSVENMVIGLGNAGTQIVKEITNSPLLEGVKLYSIDSTLGSIELDTINRIKSIPIISDEKEGSGRNRERGAAMFSYHYDNKDFDSMFLDASNVKSPVVVVTSAAGGTGSGSCVPLCKELMSMHIPVVPIIICPNMDDPAAYHLNTSDLMVELGEIGITTYAIFRNPKGSTNYGPINKEIVNMIEIMFGKKYRLTDKDSIDDSDLDVVLSTPGRFIAVSAHASDINTLKRELTQKVFSGYQPAWSADESKKATFITAYSLTSMFADTDYETVFEDINKRILDSFDNYKNICVDDNNGECEATLMIAGLPRAEMKKIDADYKEASNIADGIERSKRPGFMNRRRAVVNQTSNTNGDAVKQFKWVRKSRNENDETK